MTDYAVVVGIGHYPDLAGDGLADLQGPGNDAAAVRDWLLDPGGGGLQPGNVRFVAQPEVDAADPRPAAADVERQLRWLEAQTRDVPGRRLYLYFSGHGFAPVLEEGALFTAEASQVFPSYVYAHAWLRWFRRAQRFSEFVLWMDSCMNWQQSIPVLEVLARPKVGTGVPGPTFLGLAAQTKSALEYPMPDGQVHGVFTWTLLQGLRGAAADERNQVTGESLSTYLHTVMPEFLPEQARRSAAVDLSPLVRSDGGLVFQRVPATPRFPVRLSAPAAAGQQLTLWTGRPHRAVLRVPLDDEASWSGRLPRGLYLAELPACGPSGAGLRQGFQVSGAGPVAVTLERTGPAVIPPAAQPETFALEVTAGNPAAAITVTGPDFERTFTATGQLQGRDLAGLCKVRVQFGRDITMLREEVLLLDRDTVLDQPPAPPLASPAPLPGAAHARPAHEQAFQAGVAAAAPAGAVVSVLARYLTAEDAGPQRYPDPLQGLSFRSADGGVSAELSGGGLTAGSAHRDPLARWERQIGPGFCYLRQQLPQGVVYEAALPAFSGRVTQVVLRRADSDAVGLDGAIQPRVGAIGDAAVFVRPAGAAPQPAQDEVLEAARLALVQGRNPFAEGRGDQLRGLLLREYADPVAGLIGAQLLLRAIDGAPAGAAAQADRELFERTVVRLRGLTGPGNPDVEALSLRCGEAELRGSTPFRMPPLLAASWWLMVEGSFDRPELVPDELWQRVHACGAVGAFFVYAVDEASRQAHAGMLARWAAQFDPGQEDQARGAARRMHLPAAAAARLLQDRASGRASATGPATLLPQAAPAGVPPGDGW